jgi:hypothetical protein
VTHFRFTATEPGIAYEYRVALDGRGLGRVRKQDAATWPYSPTRKWVADDGCIARGNFPTRRAAAEWLRP